MTDSRPLETAMMAVHDRLEGLFFRHQSALLDRDLTLARALLTEFTALILTHADDEERWILPAYVEVGGDATDSPARQFRLEHDKIRSFLAEIGDRLAADPPADDLARRRDILAILDRESWFKSLLAHHDLRERRVLYPRLSQSLEFTRQTELLSRLSSPRASP
ncbi:MAG: hemerythrin domain-containing protein [Planctomycetota bacterium]